jgi:dienelactone hydrolase
VARRLGTENFMAFAPDGLTSVGGYPGNNEEGGALFAKVDRAKMTEDFVAAANWLRARPESTGKLGVVGFCFGGGIANTLAVRLGADLAAAVPFYGSAPPAADVPKIRRRCSCTTASSTSGWWTAGPPTRRRSKPRTCATRATCIPTRTTASTTTRRPPVCRRCGGPLKVVAYITDTVAIRRIPDHLARQGRFDASMGPNRPG